ncbi:putative disease resistance RPP13 protein [Trifolium repens]|nr:putative disease resistance RPP13 protein [Trifolium repens]
MQCIRFPIVAKTIGGVLSSDIDSKHWNAILNDTIWDVSNNNVMSELLFSYQCIPPHLKRCFTYCSIFSKGYRFDKNHMVLLWMAHGFIENSVVGKAAEEVGSDYFVELLSRSLIGQVNDDTDKGKFFMNNLIHDSTSTISVKESL